MVKKVLIVLGALGVLAMARKELPAVKRELKILRM